MKLDSNLLKIEKRKFKEKKIIVATHNKGKLIEIRELLKDIDVEVFSSIELNLPVPKENGSTFEENAVIKSSQTTLLSGHASISDDSGLMIDSLGGSPGIYSADWSGKNRIFNNAINKIEYLMRYKEDFNAKMVCVLCLTWPDKKYKIFKGEMRGKIQFPPKGYKGFGYDPIFIPLSKSITFGQMPKLKKIRIDHRYVAFRKMKQKIKIF